MTDHAHELRTYSRKIGHPAGDVPSVMLAAADEIERLAARLEAAEKDSAHHKALAESALRVAKGWEGKCRELRTKIEAAEKEREIDEQRIADLMAELNRVGHENDALRTKIEHMENQEPAAEWLPLDSGEDTRRD